MTLLKLPDPRWLNFVHSCADALPFHHPAWVELLAECYGYRALALALTDNAGQIRAGVPVMEVGNPLGRRRWITLPFTDYCPLLTDGHPVGSHLDALADELRAQHADQFELRAPLPQHSRVHPHTAGVRHTLALEANPDAVYRRFGKMHQRNIRSAERAGVRIEHGHTAADMQHFYDLHLPTRKRLGVPIQPRRFFDLLARRLLADRLGFVATAYVEQTPIAAAIFLAWNGVLIYKYGASDQAFRQQRPNNLLFWDVIRWGCENGYRLLDFGRTDLDHQGLREFKNGWGTEEQPLIYSAIADSPPRKGSGRAGKVIGSVIRRSPPWVCRTIGELFYRYAA